MANEVQISLRAPSSTAMEVPSTVVHPRESSRAPACLDPCPDMAEVDEPHGGLAGSPRRSGSPRACSSSTGRGVAAASPEDVECGKPLDSSSERHSSHRSSMSCTIRANSELKIPQLASSELAGEAHAANSDDESRGGAGRSAACGTCARAGDVADELQGCIEAIVDGYEHKIAGLRAELRRARARGGSEPARSSLGAPPEPSGTEDDNVRAELARMRAQAAERLLPCIPGFASELERLAESHEGGEGGLPRDAARARMYWEAAALHGSWRAAERVGLALLDEADAPRDGRGAARGPRGAKADADLDADADAEDEAEAAAEEERVRRAQFFLTLAATGGEGGAGGGSAEAAFRLALLWLDGRAAPLGAGGAAGDAPAQEAARWLQRAADGGHVLAKYQLATMLAQGEGGVAVDTRRAHALFQAWERECAAQAAREEAALEEAALEAAAPAEPADDGALDAAAAAAGGVQVRAGPGAEGGSGRGGGRGGELLDVTNVARRSLGARESEGGGDELGLKVQALRARIARVSGLGAA